MPYRNLLLEVTDRVAILTIHRPDKLNALDHATVEEIGAAAAQIATDEEVAALIITGSGPKAFVAGADIGELAKLDPAAARRTSRRGQSVLNALEAMPKPVIAAVNGFALGGGLELALACHLRVVAEDAHDQDDMVDRAGSIAFRDGFAKAGQRVIIVAGVPLGIAGTTNMVRIANVEPEGEAKK
jgi:enoyl-CoA hydratase/carnithine racemase